MIAAPTLFHIDRWKEVETTFTRPGTRSPWEGNPIMIQNPTVALTPLELAILMNQSLFILKALIKQDDDWYYSATSGDQKYIIDCLRAKNKATGIYFDETEDVLVLLARLHCPPETVEFLQDRLGLPNDSSIASDRQKKPATTIKSKPATTTKSKPATTTKSKPATTTKSKPATIIKSKPATGTPAI